jgi:hypothetical protein
MQLAILDHKNEVHLSKQKQKNTGTGYMPTTTNNQISFEIWEITVGYR